jgi:hypothetical protein
MSQWVYVSKTLDKPELCIRGYHPPDTAVGLAPGLSVALAPG